MTCSKCGRTNPAGAVVCADCGARLPAGADATLTQADSGISRAPTFAQGTGPAARSGSADRLQPGTRLGERYEIEAVLGEGGMGTVYKARDRALDRTVALKVIRPEMAARPEILERFKREILLASKVTHKNVLRIHDLGEADGIRFLSMSYVEGSNLKTLLASEGPLPLDRALPLIRQIGEALQAAHEAGIVHRDLKPQNILIDPAGNAYIADFGISRSIESGATMTETGMILGTVDYMCPEQARGETPDHRGDIFSFGVILFEMLTGTLPFRSDNPLSVMMKRLHEDAPTVRQARPQVPAWISSIVARAMQRDPAARYQSVADLLRDLGRQRASRDWRRHLIRRVFPAIGIVALLVLAGRPLIERLRALVQGRPAASAPAQALALMPFENGTGNTALDWIGTGFPALVSNGLRDAGGLRLLGADRTHETLSDLRLPQTGAYGASDLKRAAMMLGADILVTGSIRRAGDLFQAEARLQRAGSQGLQEVGLEHAEGRGEESIFALADSLARAIARDLGLGSPGKAGSQAMTTRSVEALRLYSLGLDLARGGRDLDAAARLEEATAKDPAFALAHTALSQAYDRLGQRDRALLASDRAVKNLAGVSPREARLIRARNALLSNRLDDGIAEYRELLRSEPQDVDARGELGSVLEQKGDLAAAAAEFERCVAIDPKDAQARYGLARVRTKLGDNESAVTILNDMLASFTQAANDEGIATVEHALGNVDLQRGRYPAALASFRRALDIRTRIQDRRGMATSLRQIAFILNSQGQANEAIQSSREALDLLTALGDRRGIATQWSSLGEIYESAGRVREAQSCYQESLKIVRDLDDPRLLAQNFSSLGNVSSVLGDYVQAYFFYQEALAKRRALGDRRELLRSLIDIGLVEQMQGRYDKALAYALEGLDLGRDIGEKAGLTVLSINIGSIHDEQGHYGAALKSLGEGAEEARALGDKGLLASALLYLGGTLAHIGDLTTAGSRLEEASRLALESGSDALMPEILIDQAEVRGAGGDQTGCLKRLRDALKRAEALGDPRLVIMARVSLGRWSVAFGRQDGLSQLRRAAEEAGRRALLPLRLRALAALAEGRLSKIASAESAAAADEILKNGAPLKSRESLLVADRVLARRAAASGRPQEATRIYLEAGQYVREMADGLQAGPLGFLRSRKDLVRLRDEAIAHISRYGTPEDRQSIAADFSPAGAPKLLDK